MIKKEIIEDIQEKIGFKVNIDELPIEIIEEIKVIEKLYKEIIYQKNILKITKNNRKKLILFKNSKKLNSSNKEENKLSSLKREYNDKLQHVCNNIKKFINKKIENISASQKVIKIDGNVLIDKLSRLKINALKCPNCGAPLHINPNDKYIKCEYCGSIFTLEDINNVIEKLFKLDNYN